MKTNKLTINYDKTKYMIITQKKKKPQSEVKIGKNTIEEVSQIKYLGVFCYEKLSWKNTFNISIQNYLVVHGHY